MSKKVEIKKKDEGDVSRRRQDSHKNDGGGQGYKLAIN